MGTEDRCPRARDGGMGRVGVMGQPPGAAGLSVPLSVPGVMSAEL